MCSLIYRPRHQVTSQIVIWTTRVIDLSVLLIFILILFFRDNVYTYLLFIS